MLGLSLCLYFSLHPHLLKISATAFIVAANFKALHGCVLTQRQPGEGVGLWQDDEVVAGAG